MQVSNSTLSGPSDPLGCYYSSARLTNDANGKPHFTEVMGSAEKKYLESPPSSKTVALSDKAVALSSQETEDEDADLSLLACWTPAELARFTRNYTESERLEELDIMVFNSQYSPGCDCSELTADGGQIYYATTRIPVTPESEIVDRRQSDTFVAQLKSMYKAERNKGSSALDIYKKIGKLILSQPDDFAYKFGFSVTFRERVESMQWGGRANPVERQHGELFTRSHATSDESDVAMLTKMKDGFSHNRLQQRTHDMERDRQHQLMDLLYGKVNHKSKPAGRRV
ncbi:hypothetical protein [Achromobacter sp. 2789STDY5608621]|uniref:hypothetical protein n=1 Tax=Achromobacter sp. 2789STDY5608621 TaxID=1806496 RepID=UPI0006C5D504|nr:hypothetical protein [Achromobacter sp. 2789STDY5608621]CUJ68366.1 Uncharacterised protein [Achromobacter sp. 2789STDY5608621]